MKQKIYIAALLAGMLALAGCGGGNSGTPVITMVTCEDGTEAATQAECPAPVTPPTYAEMQIEAVNEATTATALAEIEDDLDKTQLNGEELEKFNAAVTKKEGEFAVAASAEAVRQEIAKINDATDADAVDDAVTAAKARSEILEDDYSKLDEAGTIKKGMLTVEERRQALETNRITDVTSATQAQIDALQAAIDSVQATDGIDTAPYQTQVDQAGQIHDLEAALSALKAALNAPNFQAGTTPEAIEEAIRKVEDEKQDLMEALADATDLSDAQKQEYQTVHDGVDSQVAGAKDRFTIAKKAADMAREAADKARTALGKAMYAALGPPTAEGPVSTTNNALENIEDFVSTINAETGLFSGGLGINPVDTGAGALSATATTPRVVLKASKEEVGSLGSWKGTDYAHSTGTGDDKYDDHEARVYHNQGAPKTRPFEIVGSNNGVYPLVSGSTVDTNNPNGYLGSDTNTVRNLSIPASSQFLPLIRADAFNHEGTKIHEFPDNTQVLLVRGTLAGAPGEFRCTGATCSSTNNGSDAPSALAGTW